jgi:hypothetical protein
VVFSQFCDVAEVVIEHKLISFKGALPAEWLSNRGPCRGKSLPCSGLAAYVFFLGEFSPVGKFCLKMQKLSAFWGF